MVEIAKKSPLKQTVLLNSEKDNTSKEVKQNDIYTVGNINDHLR